MKKKIFAVAMVCMLALSSVTVMAAPSPQAPLKNSINLDGSSVDKDNHANNKVTGGTVSIEVVDTVVKDGKEYQVIQLTANPDGSNSFSKWNISGDYEIISGSLEDGTLQIVVYGDINVTPEFKDASGNVITKGDKDPSTQSPQTGVAAGLLVLAMVCSGTVAVASRKKFED